MKTLLHVCCAPCSITCVESLRGENIEPVGFWYNPNIHPYIEYRSRRETLIEYAKQIGMKLEIQDEYGLKTFITKLNGDLNDRCEKCYDMRLSQTAKFAAENGYSQFTTTLLISPYQNHELLKSIGENAAQKYGIEFLYRDFRPTFRDGQQKSRAMELYMQKYCGCVFSEEERYYNKINKDIERFKK